MLVARGSDKIWDFLRVHQIWIIFKKVGRIIRLQGVRGSSGPPGADKGILSWLDFLISSKTNRLKKKLSKNPRRLKKNPKNDPGLSVSAI
jgi:hypothetical protein